MTEELDSYSKVYSKQKTMELDPITFKWHGPTEDEKLWHVLNFDGRELLDAVEWLYQKNIHEYYWMDRAPDRMVHRYNIYFKNEKDLIFFKLGFL